MDAAGGRELGLDGGRQPKSGSEFWGRTGSTIMTVANSEKDMDILINCILQEN